MTDPLGPVQIGAREIYDAVVRVGTAVERLTDQHADIERTVDGHDEQLRLLTPVPAQVIDHESRLRALESARWPLPAASLLVALAALAVGLLPKLTP
ncbi:hypothetical protein MCAG_03821 [Micromonospora sp. ATCC 39149]|uniref:hypothetical protein n=1 Tax=Micromonospora sp. (strain ATCC 39149 / NRRL 15099 / SCC 1413) TaxID=219305 RepID=UPI0001A504C8|nr:hypothetical protein [Micromonospora sp. ATCC 39149]EEP73494.1 hypothetical protein MCAG_03821 [Micromonospora sp. ATCC 39149]